MFNFFKRGKNLEDKIASLELEYKTLSEENQRISDAMASLANSDTDLYTYSPDKKKNYSSHVAIQATIDMKANILAELPIKVVLGDKELPEDSSLAVKGSSFAFNFNNPNPTMSKFELFKYSMSYYLYMGEFFWFVDTSAGGIIINLLNPKNLQLRNGLFTYKNKPIDNENLIWIKQFNPDKHDAGDDQRGTGLIDAIVKELDNDLEAQNYINSCWKNSIFNGGQIVVDPDSRMRTEELDVVVKKFNQTKKGTSNAGAVIGMPKGMRHEIVAQHIIDNQVLPLREETTHRILIQQGVPKALFGFLDGVNRAVNEEAKRQLIEYSIKPDAAMIASKLNQQFLSKYFKNRYKMSFDFSGIPELQENKESLLNQAKLYQSLGYTQTEINTKLNLGMPKVEDPLADTRFIPNSLIPFDNVDFSEEPEPEPEPKPEPAPEETPTKSVRLTKAAVGSKYNALHNKIALSIKGKVSKEFGVQLKKIKKLLYKKSSLDYKKFLAAVEKYLKEHDWNVLEPVYTSSSEKADKYALDLLGIKESPVARPKVVGNLINKIKGLDDVSYYLIKRQVTEAVEAGETISEIGERIDRVFKFNASRRTKIARTESAAIINQSANERYVEAEVKQKEWLNAGDKEVRDTHVANAAKGVVKYDHVYSNGQQFPNDGAGGPENNVNCRCTIVPVI